MAHTHTYTQFLTFWTHGLRTWQLHPNMKHSQSHRLNVKFIALHLGLNLLTDTLLTLPSFGCICFDRVFEKDIWRSHSEFHGTVKCSNQLDGKEWLTLFRIHWMDASPSKHFFSAGSLSKLCLLCSHRHCNFDVFFLLFRNAVNVFREETKDLVNTKLKYTMVRSHMVKYLKRRNDPIIIKRNAKKRTETMKRKKREKRQWDKYKNKWIANKTQRIYWMFYP